MWKSGSDHPLGVSPRSIVAGRMSAYGDLLKTPGVARIVSAQLIARLPAGMLSLGVLMHVEQTHDSYGAAGLVLAALSIGQAVSGPLLGRWMGAWRMRPVIAITMAVCTAAIAVLALALPVWAFVLVALLVGLSTPPIQPAVRTIYPKMVNSKQLTPLFSLDASAQEVIWIAGPVAITFISTQIGTAWGVLVPAALTLIGGLFFLSSPELGRVRIPRSRGGFGKVLLKPIVAIATVVGMLLIGTAAAVEAGVVAVFGHDGLEAGIVLAVFAVGSLVGGLAFGHIGISPWAVARRMAVVAVGVALASALLEAWWLSIALLIAGLGIAPALAAIFTSVSSTLRFSETAEAYGWVGTGQLIGAAAGSALAGFMIDGVGPQGAFWVGGALAVLGVIVAVVSVRWLPDLRGKDAGPRPDTEPVELVG